MIKNLKSELMMFFVAFSWGTGFIATQIALDNGMQTHNTNFFRFLFATICLYIFMKIKKIRLDKKYIIPGLVLGALLTSGYILQTIGLKYTTPAKNALFTGMNVIFVPYISHIFFKRKIDRYIIIASMLAFLGTVVISGDITSLSMNTINYGDILTIISAVFFAFQVVFIGHFVKSLDPIKLSFAQLFSTTIFSFIFTLGYKQFNNITVGGIGATLYLGIVCTFICFSLQIMAQKDISASKAAVILSLEVVFGTFLSIAMGYDPFKLTTALGTIIILTGIVIAEIKLSFIKGDKNE